MFMEVKKEIKLIFLNIKYNLAKEMLNKITFFTNIFFMIINNASFIIQWIIIYSIKDNIGGYTLKDIILLWGLASGTYAICFIVFGGVIKLPNLIMNGKIDVYMIQPKNILVSILSSFTKVSAIGDLIYAYILLFIYGFTIKNFLLYTLFIITGGIIITAILTITGSLAFWITRADSITHSFMGTMLSIDTYPESIFNNSVKILLYTIIPVGLTAYLPIRLIKNFMINNFLIVIVFTFFIASLAFYVFYQGLKRYTSSNLMNARI